MKTIEFNQIAQGDAHDVLKTVPTDTFDLGITSPPYNIGVHTTHGFKHNPYSDNLPEEEYQTMQIKVLNELFRVIKPTGSLFYNHKNRIVNQLSLSPYEWLKKSQWLVKQEIVWINGSPNMAKVRFYPFTERIYWLVKKPETQLQNIISHTDVFNGKEWPAVGSGDHALAKLRDAQGRDREVEHTRQFPLQMPLDIMKCFPEAETVIDCYMGSGTVALAAIKLGKKWFGVERNADYIALANKRLEGQQETTLESWSRKL